MKSKFNRLSSENKVSGEIRLLMQSMLALLDIICAIFLEKNTAKTPVNSSKPSSQNIPLYGGVLIHDCLSSYLSYDHCDHELCGAHLLRELTFIVDAHDHARKMRTLSQGTCKTVSKSKQKKLIGPAYKNLQKRYRTILTQGAKEIPEKPKGQRGRIAKSDAHNLWKRLKVHEVSVLRFAKNGDVAFTDNRSERDLRMSKVKQKVSGCFRQVVMARAYCRISGYLQSVATKGVSPLIAIQMALAGEIVAFWGE
ncbi:MAG: transposase [Reinekea sp.]